MNKQNFLIDLFEYYNLSDIEIDYRLNSYISQLNNNVDYSKLIDIIKREYSSLPSIAQINTIISNQKPYKSTNISPLEHIQSIKNTPKLDFNNIDGKLKQQLIDFHQKYKIKTKIKELQN